MEQAVRKVALASPAIQLGDPIANAAHTAELAAEAAAQGAEILGLPWASLWGHSLGSLIRQTWILERLNAALAFLRRESQKWPRLALLLTAPTAGTAGFQTRLLRNGLLTDVAELRDFRIAVLEPEREGPSDGFAADVLAGRFPRLAQLSRDRADLIFLPSADAALPGRGEARGALLQRLSADLGLPIAYTSTGEGESTTDQVYSGQILLAENAFLRAERPQLAGAGAPEILCAAIHAAAAASVRVNLEVREPDAAEAVDPAFPFLPLRKETRAAFAEDCLRIQAKALACRLRHVAARTSVIGISGGLDSTLALLVAIRAQRLLGEDLANIHAITMPGFGTSERTKSNAYGLLEASGVTWREIPITDAVTRHFSAIGQDPGLRDTTYENSQARERTQILMDYANRTGGLVIGTGDLSELALGWCTYNGDHMSMYAVNASIPKTLGRYLLACEAERIERENAASGSEIYAPRLPAFIRAVIETPVSPELLPPSETGAIAQRTEDRLGPYLLHDFILWHCIHEQASPEAIFLRALNVFSPERIHGWDGTERLTAALGDAVITPRMILNTLRVFYRRFITQQYKRSCMPDGPQVSPISLSPRGAWRMPSDLSPQRWIDEINRLERSYLKGENT